MLDYLSCICPFKFKYFLITLKKINDNTFEDNTVIRNLYSLSSDANQIHCLKKRAN